MNNNLKMQNDLVDQILIQPTDETAEYILANASDSAKQAFNSEISSLYARNADKSAGRLKYMLVKRFIAANTSENSEKRGLVTLSHFFPDINGVVFHAKYHDMKNSISEEMFFFKGTSIKIYDKKWLTNKKRSEHVADQWYQDHLSEIESQKDKKALRKEELQNILSKVEIGSVFAVYMVNEGKTPLSVGPPQDFYQVTEVVSKHSVIVRRLATKFTSNNILSRTPVPNVFESEAAIKRLAMAVFTDDDGARYNYLRFSTGGSNKHGYLLELNDHEYSVYRASSASPA